MTVDTFTFGSAEYRPVPPSPPQWTPIPRPKKAAQWTHVPYGPNKRESDGGKLHTVWQVRIWLPTPDDLAAMQGYYDSDALQTLVTPFGTFQAVLADLPDMEYDPTDDSAYGTVTWEWP